MISYDNLNTMGVMSATDAANWEAQRADEKVMNFIGSTLVDVGTSLWNSVTPESYNVATKSVLQDMGAVGAAAAYEMNKDTVETLSFVGGMLIPGLAATKIARGVRAAMKGTSWLSDVRHVEDLAKFNKLIESGLEGTQQYKAVRNSIYLRGQAANIMDVAAAEAAIGLTMNAHPYMEDYWQDPVSNFATSMLIGGAIGGGITHLVTRSQLKTAVGSIESAAINTVEKAAQYNTPTLSDGASAIAALDIAAGNLNKLASLDNVNELTRQHAKSWALSMEAKQGEIFSNMAAPEIRDLVKSETGKLALENIRATMKDPKFFGVDHVEFFKAPNKAFSLTGQEFATAEAPTWKRILKTGPKAGTEKFIGRQYYSQELGGFLTKSQADLAASAADVHTASSISKMAKKMSLQRPANGFDELASTADTEAYYLANIEFYHGQKAVDLAKGSKIGVGDLPAMNGWASAVTAKMQATKAVFNAGEATQAHLDELKALSDAKLTIQMDGGRAMQVTVDQARATYLHETGERIRRDVLGGMPREVAALRYNTTQDMVDLAVSKPDGLAGLMWANGPEKALPHVIRFSEPSHIELALSPTRRTLAVGASESKMMGETGVLLQKQHESILESKALSVEHKRALEDGDTLAQQRVQAKAAVLDEQYAAISKIWVETSVLTGRSQMLSTMMHDVVDSAEVKVLREGLQEMVNGKGGNPLYQSADFVTSLMGRVGTLITGIGDKRAHLANKEFERLATPISQAFKKLIADPAARTEFAMMDNFRQSTPGWIKYDKGLRTFVTKTEGGEFVQVGAPIVKNDIVHDAMKALDDAAGQVYDSQKVLNRIKGKTPPADIGTWIPSLNLSNKHRGFVVNHDTGTIKLLVANTADDLKTLMNEYAPARNETILTAAEVANTKIAGMSDELMDNIVRVADATKLKKGIGLVAPDVSGDRLAEIINGLRDRVNYQATSFVETSLHDVMQKLDWMSATNQAYNKGQGQKGWLQAVKQAGVKDTAADIKDYLLGKNPAHRSQLVGLVNQAASATIQVGISAFSKAWEVAKPAFGSKTAGVDYDGFMKALDAQGIQDPFKVFHEAARPLLLQRAKNSGYSVTPDRLVNGGNALAATLALRFMELAQPLVNMMSLPILTTSTIARTIKGNQVANSRELLKASPLSVMMNGVRRAHSNLPENEAFLRMFKEEGLLDPIISEADEVMKLSRIGSGGVVGTVERALDSTFVRVLSKPSEISETMVRKYSLMTGVELGRRLYGPNASQRQIALFARDFMKQSIGNYSTSQRPMMFQGTFGAAAGLFQTYMLTYAQSLYRHVELGDYKGLGKTMLAQAGIFGVGSLPGFQPISQAIGEHFSDEHWDLVSGTYRALPDPMADLLIYGMPSNIAPDVHTRGDVNPRVPGSVSTMVAPSMVLQSLETMFNAGKELAKLDATSGQGFLEALSMQSVSRPIARGSELALRAAMTRQGNQVAGEEEVWSMQGVLARVFSTRTLQESKTREAMHLNSYYGAIDSENRAAVLKKLRTALRAGQLDSDELDSLAYEYLRTGSPQGFRSAVTQAFMENDNPGLVDLTAKLKQSPLMSIIEDID